MTGHREILMRESEIIIEKCYFGNITPTKDECDTLRDCWECSKYGNLMMNVIDNLGLDGDFARTIVESPHFLTTHELWHTRRVRNRNVIMYRGCSREEVDAVKFGEEMHGLSWTLSKDIAEFFALRQSRTGNVVLTAHAPIYAWLDTGEHEVISPYVTVNNIIKIEEVVAGADDIVRIDWNSRPRLRPHHFAIPTF